MADRSASEDPNGIARWLRSAADLLFGYDFFISYAHSDGGDYPRTLAHRLEASGFRVFLDSRVYVAGDDLRLATRRRVRMSRKLIVVVGRHAVVSGWVLREIQECIAAGRAPIAVDINEALAKAPEDSEVKQHLRNKLYLSETLSGEAHEPSDHTVQELVRSFDATRQDAKRSRVIGAAAVLFAALAVLAAWQAHVAEKRREEAVEQRNIAQSRALAANATAQLRTDPEVSVLLALESLAIRRTEEAERSLRLALPNLYAERTLHGHTDPVRVARFSPDGAFVLTASFDATAALWNATTGQQVAVLSGHEGALYDAAFSPDGARIVTSSADGTIRVWSTNKGELVHELKGFGVKPTLVSFSADGAHVVASTVNSALKIYATETGEAVLSERLGHGYATRSGRWLITIDADEHVSVVDAGSFRVRSRLSPEGAFIPGGLDASGDRLVTSDGRGTAMVWATRAGERIATLSGHDAPIVAAAFSTKGGEVRVATASRDHTVRIWFLNAGRPAIVLRGHGGPVTGVTFSPDGRWLASGSSDRTVRVWDTLSGRPVAEYIGHDAAIESLAFHPEGQRLLSAGGGTARIWRVTDEQTVTRFWRSDEKPFKVFVNDVGGILATTGTRRSPAIWGARTGVALAPLPASAGLAMHAEFHSNNRNIALAGFDGVVRVWNELRRRMVAGFRGHDGPVMTVAFSPDGREVASGGSDGTIRLWRPKKAEPRLSIAAHSASVLGIAFSRDGKRLVSSAADGTARLWDPATGAQLGEALEHSANVTSVDFDESGETVVTTTNDRYAYVWDVTSRARTHALQHPATVTNALFMPEGRWIITGCQDGRLRLWDPASGALVSAMRTRGPRPRWVNVDATGDWLLTSEDDDAAYRYPWEMLAPLATLETLARQRLRRTLSSRERERYLE